MAGILSVTEYNQIALDAGARGAQTGQEPNLASYDIAIGGASAPGPAFNQYTTIIRVHASAACRVQIGPSPTAIDGQSMRMAANSTEFFGVKPGHQVAVIQSAV